MASFCRHLYCYRNVQLSPQHKDKVRERVRENVSWDKDEVQLTAAEKQELGEKIVRNAN